MGVTKRLAKTRCGGPRSRGFFGSSASRRDSGSSTWQPANAKNSQSADQQAAGVRPCSSCALHGFGLLRTVTRMSTGQQLEAFSTTFGLVASLALHLSALAYITSATAQYDFDFALALPAEVEFGLTGEMEMAVRFATTPSDGLPRSTMGGQRNTAQRPRTRTDRRRRPAGGHD